MLLQAATQEHCQRIVIQIVTIGTGERWYNSVHVLENIIVPQEATKWWT